MAAYTTHPSFSQQSRHPATKYVLLIFSLYVSFSLQFPAQSCPMVMTCVSVLWDTWMFQFRAYKVNFTFLISIWHFLTFLLTFLAIFGSSSMLCMPVHSVNPFAWSPSPMPQVFPPTGKFGSFDSFGVLLMSSAIFAVVFLLIQLFCMCMHPPNASAWSPGLCSSSVRNSGLLPGKLGFFWLVWGLLTHSAWLAPLLCLHTPLCLQ